jgi:hypothetical protein
MPLSESRSAVMFFCQHYHLLLLDLPFRDWHSSALLRGSSAPAVMSAPPSTAGSPRASAARLDCHRSRSRRRCRETLLAAAAEICWQHRLRHHCSTSPGFVACPARRLPWTLLPGQRQLSSRRCQQPDHQAVPDGTARGGATCCSVARCRAGEPALDDFR